MIGDAEDYDLNPIKRPGNPVREGFQDKDGVYPKYQYDRFSDVNEFATHAADITKDTRGTRSARKKLNDAQTSAKLVSEPEQGPRSVYPKNQALETRSGHLIEYDDTPGNERLNFRHRSGSKVEMLPDGSVVVKSTNRSYSITASDSDVVIRGQAVVVIESNADVRVQGDMTLQVDGDFSQIVQGDYSLEVQGSKTERVHTDSTDSVTGGRLEETRGNVIKRNLSNYKERTVGDHSSEYGGTWRMTAEGSVRHMSYGPFTGSYYGGLVTLNGKNLDGEEGAGQLIANKMFMTELHGTDMYLDGRADISTDVTVGQNIDAGSRVTASEVHAASLEGTAKKAEYADTAGAAPTGSPVVKIPSPASADSPANRTQEPDSTESVVEVVDTSDPFILALDRRPEAVYNKRVLDTGEVRARARNDFLLNDQDWVSDQVNQGSVLESIVGGSAPNTKRSASLSDVASGEVGLSQTALGPYKIFVGDQLRVKGAPAHMKPKRIARSSLLSPNFRLSHMLAGDALAVPFCDQVGLSRKELFENMQLLAYNILEPLRDKYRDTWTVSEGLYCPLEGEKISSGGITEKMVQGLGVGIQFPSIPNSGYFDVAQWMANHLVFDKLMLSYFDYDPSGINEPTIIVTIDHKNNSRELLTDFNHEIVDSNLLDLTR